LNIEKNQQEETLNKSLKDLQSKIDTLEAEKIHKTNEAKQIIYNLKEDIKAQKVIIEAKDITISKHEETISQQANTVNLLERIEQLFAKPPWMSSTSFPKTPLLTSYSTHYNKNL
jgi:hypothetical protein